MDNEMIQKLMDIIKEQNNVLHLQEERIARLERGGIKMKCPKCGKTKYVSIIDKLLGFYGCSWCRETFIKEG